MVCRSGHEFRCQAFCTRCFREIISLISGEPKWMEMPESKLCLIIIQESHEYCFWEWLCHCQYQSYFSLQLYRGEGFNNTTKFFKICRFFDKKVNENTLLNLEFEWCVVRSYFFFKCIIIWYILCLTYTLPLYWILYIQF